MKTNIYLFLYIFFFFFFFFFGRGWGRGAGGGEKGEGGTTLIAFACCGGNFFSFNANKERQSKTTENGRHIYSPVCDVTV